MNMKLFQSHTRRERHRMYSESVEGMLVFEILSARRYEQDASNRSDSTRELCAIFSSSRELLNRMHTKSNCIWVICTVGITSDWRAPKTDASESSMERTHLSGLQSLLSLERSHLSSGSKSVETLSNSTKLLKENDNEYHWWMELDKRYRKVELEASAGRKLILRRWGR